MDLFVVPTIASTCSMSSSSSGWPAETLSGSMSQRIRPRNGSHARLLKHSLGTPRYLIRDRDCVYGAVHFVDATDAPLTREGAVVRAAFVKAGAEPGWTNLQRHFIF